MTRRLWQRAAAGGLGIALVASAAWAQGGGVNVEKYVAIGDSLTAAFSSGGLSIEQQVDSYPALIHQAFQAVGGPTETFEQPLVSAPGLPAQLALQGLFPTVIVPRSNQPGQPINLTLGRPYDNLGVPGARMHDPANTRTGGAHDLVLRGLGTVLELALVQRPTVVTVQVGNNDVLAAATQGIVIDGVTLTPVESFTNDLIALIGPLVGSGVQVAIANLPEVTTVPFVTTIPPVVVNPATNEPVLDPNGQPIPLIGPNGRPLTPNDHVLLTASAELARGIGIPAIPGLGGTGQPLSNTVVLDADETARIQARVAELNEVIRTVAETQGAALVDINGLFNGIVADGLVLGGIDFSAEFLTGGLFSYDGVHPTRLGYGVIANAFIEAINDTFGAAVPLVDLQRLAFEPPITPNAAAGVTTASADSRWTPFVYTEDAWKNLQYALGIDAGATETPRLPGSPTLPSHPDRIRPLTAPGPASISGGAAVRRVPTRHTAPTAPRQPVQRRIAVPR